MAKKKRKRRPGSKGATRRRLVYIQLRVWDPDTNKMRHVPKSTISVENWTPGQVHRVIVDALAAAHERARKALENGQANEERATDADAAGG